MIWNMVPVCRRWNTPRVHYGFNGLMGVKLGNYQLIRRHAKLKATNANTEKVLDIATTCLTL